VRASVERAVGPTVGRAASARLLGVSQTALDRWIASGDVPVALTPGGRREVPLAALAELIDAVERQGDTAARPPCCAHAARAWRRRSPRRRSTARSATGRSSARPSAATPMASAARTTCRRPAEQRERVAELLPAL
jgi:hypothetical protein